MTLPLFDDDMPEASAWKREARNPLRLEMNAAVLRIDGRQIEMLRGLGAPAAQLFAAGAIGVTRVETDSRDYWQPLDAGRALLVTPMEEDGYIVDLIAFDIHEPDAWFLRTGGGWALGGDAIEHARGGWGQQDRRLFLHPRPLDWLQSGRVGACITRWCDDARAALRAVDAIDVSAPATARALRLELARPPRLPEIDVGRWRSDAA